MSQTCDFPVSLSWTLEQRDTSLDEDLNEDVSCEDGKDRAIAPVGKTVCLLYLGLQTLTQSRELLVTGVNPLKPQEEVLQVQTNLDRCRFNFLFTHFSNVSKLL